MKTRFLMLFALTVVLRAEAALAAKCSFREDTNDFFSGAPTLRTKWDEIAASALGNSDGLASDARQVLGILSAVQESGVPRLEVKLRFVNRSVFLPTKAELDASFAVPKGAALEVTLADGTVVDLPAIESVKAWTEIAYPYEAGNADYFTYVHATIQYELSDSSMSTLGAQNASAVRVHGEGNFKDITVPKKGVKHIKEAVHCLRQGGAE